MRIYANRIPSEIRKLLLSEDDPINNAIPSTGNKDMGLLFDIWNEFIEPTSTKELNCPICLNNIISSFKSLYPVLVELEKEEELLKNIKYERR